MISENTVNIGDEKIFNDQQVVKPVEKKRGRKPKNQTNQQIVNENDNIMNNDTQSIKKRGRKANIKIINLNQPPNIEIMTNLIAHLPLKMDDIMKIVSNNDVPKQNNILPEQIIEETKTKNMLKCVDLHDDMCDNTNKNRPQPICQKCIVYEEKIKLLNEEIYNLKNGIINYTSDFNKKICESKVNFYDKSQNQWIKNTKIACWWCCHQFDHIPLGLPEYINKDKFYLSGCFCSFNCMMAYNLDLNDYKIWNRQANIYQMKNKIDPENKMTIKPAPPRQTLQMFGGPLTIQEFRESFYMINKEFRYFLPPMTSMIGIVEEDSRDLSYEPNNRKVKHPLIKRKKPLPKQSIGLNMIVNKI